MKVEWDFGDGQKAGGDYAPLEIASKLHNVADQGFSSTGSIVIEPVDGQAEIVFKYAFAEPKDLSPDLNRKSFPYIPKLKIYDAEKSELIAERFLYVDVLIFKTLVPDLVRYDPTFEWKPDEGAGGTTMYLAAHGYPDNTGMEYRYEWDFGDGMTDSQSEEVGKKARTSHVYKKPGEYTLRIELFDNSGALGNEPLARREHKFVLGDVETKAPEEIKYDATNGVYKLVDAKPATDSGSTTREDVFPGLIDGKKHTDYSIKEWNMSPYSARTAYKEYSVRGNERSPTVTSRMSVSISGIPQSFNEGDKISISISFTRSSERNNDSGNDDVYTSNGITFGAVFDNNTFKTAAGEEIDKRSITGASGGVTAFYTCPEHRGTAPEYRTIRVETPISTHTYKYKLVEGTGTTEYTMPTQEPAQIEGDKDDIAGWYIGTREPWYKGPYEAGSEPDPAMEAIKNQITYEITEENGKLYGQLYNKSLLGWIEGTPENKWIPYYGKHEIVFYEPVTGELRGAPCKIGQNMLDEPIVITFTCTLVDGIITNGVIECLEKQSGGDIHRSVESWDNINMTKTDRPPQEDFSSKSN